MESSGGGSFLRKRRLENFFNADSSPSVERPPKIVAKEEVRQRPRTNEYVDDDGWVSALVSYVRIMACFLTMIVTTFIWALIMLVLLPWPYERIRQGNVYGHVTGRLMLWILGTPIKIEGTEFSNKRAIYISNHASPIDIFLIMWTPTGTVGIAKKEIIWYPLFGQLYILANHLRIDRSNPTAAIQSMKEASIFLFASLSGPLSSLLTCYTSHSQAAHAVVRNNLSLIIFPEGSRSKNGKLLPFKKGFVHLALQSRLPIVPIVLTGTHRAWRKGSLHVRPAPLTVKYLPPIRTDDWVADKIDSYVKMIYDIYVRNLPESQRPL
ncbi:LOW QUALITY PROTEIN: Acyltransferase domain-containing protein, partial [Cephalotus follicularis]